MLCERAGGLLAWNLSAEFLCGGRPFDDVVGKVLQEHVCIVIGNYRECAALAKTFGCLSDDLPKQALHVLSQLGTTSACSARELVVLTD